MCGFIGFTQNNYKDYEIFEQTYYKLINFDKSYKEYMVYSNSRELGNSFFVLKIINLEYFMEQKWI